MDTKTFLKEFDADRANSRSNGRVRVVYMDGREAVFDSVSQVAGNPRGSMIHKAIRKNGPVPFLGIKSVSMISRKPPRTPSGDVERIRTKLMDRPIDERQAHLNLSEPCIPITKKMTARNVRYYVGDLLARFLGTPRFLRPTLACHACHNSTCRNPRHIYWGTYKENYADAVADGALKSEGGKFVGRVKATDR